MSKMYLRIGKTEFFKLNIRGYIWRKITNSFDELTETRYKYV